jgi:hypothetical protein
MRRMVLFPPLPLKGEKVFFCARSLGVDLSLREVDGISRK